ncbi:aminopeptidase N [Drosophila ficusphila]|uniref:aminopeptidase N n=1 Tax=Drosophila ficusphila TaxID=30025 RepID=UPI0007E8834B|nr:aminopeptidase N [Drosophila ficusphila]
MSQNNLVFWICLIFIVPHIKAAYDHYRLPNALEPQHYNLRILTHLNSTDQWFEGSVKIYLLARESTKNITLHVAHLKIDGDRTSVRSDQEINCITNVETNDIYNFYTLHLCRELEKDQIYQLEMHFESRLNNSLSGYYASNYTDTDTKEVHHLAVTQFSPAFARQGFPCFDEPAWKSTFNITLGYHKNFTGLTGMPVIECQTHENLENYIWCDHETLLRTSTYLVAYSVHDLKNAVTEESKTFNRVVFRNWMQPKLLNQDVISTEMAPKVLAYFENLFQVNFPLKKVDQITVPTHQFVAMENWGMVTFSEERLPLNQDNYLKQKDGFAETVAHEFAHQWFGNLVTMKWWNDLWLKEGTSTYFSYLALDALDPERSRGELFIDDNLANFFEIDSGRNLTAITKEVKGPDQISGQFSPYVYKKGSLIVRMLHKLLGDEAFFQGIRSFLKRFSLGNVVQDDLWNSLEEAAIQTNVISPDFNLSRAMDSWVLQGGYPLVTLNRDYKTGKMTLSQSRFYGGKDLPIESLCWWVPLSFVRQNQPDFKKITPQFWLECPSSSQVLELPNLPTPNEWIILNPQVSTIFRVNYDKQNWNLITESLKNDANFGGIHKINRAQLLDDIMAFAAVRLQKYDAVFDLFDYLKKENEFLPWQRVVNKLNRLGALLRGQEAKDFKIYMQKLLNALYKRFPKFAGIITSSPAIKDMAFANFVYSQSCRYHVGDCTNQAKILVSSHRNGSQIELPSDFQKTAYCSYLEVGGEMEFQEIFALFQNTTDATQRRILASTLGCSRNFQNFEQFLNLTLQSEEKVNSECYRLAVQTALNREYIVSQTGNYILSHAKIMGEKFKEMELTPLLSSFATSLQSPEELENLNVHLKDLKEFKKPLQKALDRVQTNQKWQKDCLADFKAALRKRI